MASASKEQRAYTRRALTLEVEVSAEQSKPALYVVHDYCPGGMLLLFRSGPQPAGLRRDDRLTICLSLPNQQQVRELHARVARSFVNGIGVAFIDPSPATLLALDQLADAASVQTEVKPATSELNAGKQCQVISRCQQVLSSYLFDILHDFFCRADDRLLVCARDALNDEDQSAFYEAIAELARFRQPITEAFHDVVMEGLDVLERPGLLAHKRTPEELGSFELSIVDHEEFEHWLMVTGMVSRIESHFSNELFDLLQRLRVLTGSEGFNEDNNPLGPAVICHAFCDSITVMHLQPPSCNEVCDVFELITLPHLARLYQNLSNIFVEAGVLPVIKHRPIPSEPSQAHAAAAPQPAKGGYVGGRQDNQHEVVEQKMEQKVEQKVEQNAYKVALELINLQKINRGATGGVLPPTATAEAAKEAVDYYSTKEVFEALDRLPQREVQDIKTDLPMVLERQTGQTDKQIPNELHDSIELTIDLLDSILDDALLTKMTKAHVERLKIPLLKTALRDKTFFTSPNHPARKLLNQIAVLGTTSGGKNEAADINPELMRAVTRVAERIDKKLEQSDEVFAEAVDGLTQLVNRQDESFTRNVDRTIKACEGAQKIHQARSVIRDVLSQGLVGKELPPLILTLLDLGWPKSLVITYLRNGLDSQNRPMQLQVVDDLLALMGFMEQENRCQPPNASQLLKVIAEDLGYISFDSMEIDRFIAELDLVLQEAKGGQTPPTVLIEQQDVDGRLGYTLALKTDAPCFGVDADISSGTDEEQTKWLGMAKALRCVDWISLTATPGDSQLLKLVWIDDKVGLYVFVNRKGIKALELQHDEIAGLLMNGIIEVFEEAELPLVERGVHRMLQRMHEKLVLQATHDPLTGLCNRKEFYKRLERALESARLTHTTHLLCHFNLDQFNLINNGYGHLAGDTLLKQVAGLFTAQIDEKSDVIARLGSDEFGLLLQQRTTQEGFQQADAIRKALQEDYRFNWEGKRYPVTTCVGVAPITEQTDKVAELLISADSACQIAKAAGSNRIHLYQTDDTKVKQHHETISWAALVDSALDNDSLQLYCQQIAPLNSNGTEKPHYEILLRVLDEEGKTTTPSNFIKAAELLNRMPDIDRWIIRKVFGWLIENSERIKRIDSVSINLSGCSLNDEGFLAFIQQQFTESHAPPEKVCFEVTETAAISSLSNAADFVKQLKAMGCTFALDDFGSGLSSYSYLKHLPVDFLKIDGMFVKDIHNNQADYAMVKSINELGHFLGKKTIAEYVENKLIYDHLVEIGVDYAQGYAIERPYSLDEMVC
ncbi:diguanylate cyclase/phosphodiesterase (GGDEF & EAL domains) with PAS/PAC sensor(s) [hydrothermal vent metagenome]|uniref:Diguanylate cyclase/phosphodiesterase (GGDEF & EAL domains) with PAS/PAC sensor(S) n=1 Tax=hydrothermal vent metagenome TaxID=652676 RepID=A0A3B1BEX6_9ZZZZ